MVSAARETRTGWEDLSGRYRREKRRQASVHHPSTSLIVQGWRDHVGGLGRACGHAVRRAQGPGGWLPVMSRRPSACPPGPTPPSCPSLSDPRPRPKTPLIRPLQRCHDSPMSAPSRCLMELTVTASPGVRDQPAALTIQPAQWRPI